MKIDECCPKFNPKLWDKKLFTWKGKKFIKSKVLTFFYMPINFGAVMTNLVSKAGEAVLPEGLCLSEHTTIFNMDVYLAVNKEVPESNNVTLSGKFLSKVYEGDFKQTGDWTKDFEEYAKSKKLKIKKMYMWYTTCPKCAKKYGKNYVAIIAQV